ncbi:MAG: outer membrane protein assembly factor BamB family protein [Planctomycetota bacterium]
MSEVLPLKRMLLCFAVACCAATRPAVAEDIVRMSGARGGLIVCVGLDDPAQLTRLHAGEGFIVHGLDADGAKVAAARAHVRRGGRAYGGVSAARMSGGRLPYVPNMVNLLVVTHGAPQLEPGEIMRVLAPGGKAFSLDRLGGVIAGRTIRKPVPPDTDEWTHYMYGPANNAVSQDKVVAPPRRMQWVAGPRYGRHHDRMSSVSAVVTSGGRIFSILDEGPRWSIMMAPTWKLAARDAYNGKLLWKRTIDKWHSHMQGLKSGPASLPRRLVALGDSVYATLGLNAPVSRIDAGTGKTIQEYSGTEGTTEVLLDADVLYLVTGPLPAKGQWFAEAERTLMAVRVESGEVVWRKKKWVVPSTLAVQQGRVCFFEKDRVSCLDAASGETVWRSDPIPRPPKFPSCYTPTLVATPRAVLISGGEAAGKQIFGRWTTQGEKDTITALDASTGKALWSAHHPDSGYRSPEDVFVIDDMVWFGDSRDGAKPGKTYGLDLMTGEVKVEFAPDRDIYFFHHRCHRGKATVNWLLPSRVGIEFIDFRKKHWDVNHWIRGACLYGIIPANGLTYAPQHPCACYLESKLDGFNAVAPAGAGSRFPEALPPRLEKGTAYGTDTGETTPNREDWPVYRHDGERTGSSDTIVADNVKPAFTCEVGGRLSSPVVGNGLLIVAAIDRHTVHAFDADTGDARWTYTAGGRIDSPPAIIGRLAIFGCRDGYIHCLRSRDGALVWRFRAAPLDERVVAYEQLESVWPVHGSVLVRDGVVHAVAGRSTFLDGGLRLVRLDPASGRLLSETPMDGQAKIAGKDQQDYVTWLNMPVAHPDVLSSVGDHIYMRSQPFKPDGTRLPLKAKAWNGRADAGAPPPKQDPAHAHLFSPTGFLDGSGWHRTYWVYGSDFYSGWCGYPTAGKVTPAGKIMVFDRENVYGFGRLPQYWRWTTPMGLQFFAVSRDKRAATPCWPEPCAKQATPSSSPAPRMLWKRPGWTQPRPRSKWNSGRGKAARY